MGDDFFGTNLDFDDFDKLLKNEDLIEEPISLQRFVTDKHYLGLPPLSEIQLEIGRRITQIFKPETLIELHGEEKGLEYYQNYTVNEVICQLGKGSGKDHVSRVSLAYIAYLLHCLRDPLDYFGKAAGVYVDLVNLAVNAKQAQQVFFDPLKNLLLSSPWASEVGFEPRVQEIFWFSRPVRMFSGHSEAEGWEGYEVLIVVLDEISAFKALSANAKVLTPNGWTKNKDLAVGSFVIGSDGRSNEVVGVYPQGQRKAYSVKFDDGAEVICSDDHYWTVDAYSDGRRKSRKTLRVKDFDSLQLESGNHQFRYSVPNVEPVEFIQEKELPIDPYIMGVLISEGCLSQSARFASGDQFVIDEVSKRLPETLRISDYGNYTYGIVGDGVTNEYLDALRGYNLIGCRAEDKFIPDDYLYASIENRRELLAGLMDGDGTSSRRTFYKTSSHRLKNDVVELCRGLGGSPAAKKHASWYNDTDGEKIECLDSWSIHTRTPFNPFLLPRKVESWTAPSKSLNRSIVSVDDLGYEEEMICIKVKNIDGLYVTDDYVLTHNTDGELKGQLRNKGSASEIYEMARASITSRFPSVGKVVLLSFPRFKGDFIQQRYKSVIDDLLEHGGVMLDEKVGNRGGYREATSWCLKAATWDVNPTRHREEFENEFRRDPIMARARFACEPPEMVDAYFRDPESVRAAFRFKENPLDDDGHYKEWFLGKDPHPRYIHIDLGLKRDRAALCMVHSPGLKKIKTMGGVENLPIIEMDYLQSWKAEDNSEIPFADIRATITELTKRFTVVSVTFDQWNSADMIQSLRAIGVNADLHTVAKKDYDTLSTTIYDGRFRGYWNDIVVEDELLKLKLINNTKVDHPSSGSKDLADAVAGSTFMCITNLGSELEFDIEILDEVNYNTMEAEEDTFTVDMIARNFKENRKPKSVPEEISDWLEII